MRKLALLKDFRVAGSLKRDDTEATLIEALARLQPPACIALYGPWGIGKSTLVRSAEEWWRSKERPAVFFDPWEHERHGDVLSALLFEIVEEVRKRKLLDEPGTKDVVVGLVRAFAGIGLRVGARHLLGLDKEDLAALEKLDLSEALAAWSKYRSAATQIQKDFASLVTQLAPVAGKPLVVFVDDLDRCLPDNVVVILETMKLLLCGQHGGNVIFVCALDRQIVGDAIAQRYPTSSRYSGETYLEKLFDLSLEVPPVGPDEVRGFIEKQWIESVGDEVASTFQPLGGLERVSKVLAKPVFANPRVIKRVLNRLMLFLDGGFASQEIQKWSVSDVNRFLAWVAGAERFRAFRTAFMDATPSELRALCDRQSGGVDVDPNRLGSSLGRICEAPGYNQYFESLMLKGESPDRLQEQQQPSRPGASPTFRDFDALMRRRGL